LALIPPLFAVLVVKLPQLPVDPRGGGAAGGIEQHPTVPGVGHVEIAAAVEGDSCRII
jgi:hypothetical protein